MTPTALYRHFDSDGRLLYVGLSLHPVNRLAAHLRGSAWARQVATVEIDWFDSRDEAAAAEREAIRREKPVCNIIHNVRPHRTFAELYEAASGDLWHPEEQGAVGDMVQTIEDHCARAGIDPATFCRAATGNPRLWTRLPNKLAGIERDLDRLRAALSEAKESAA